jgi:hypothetical protein
VGDALFLQHRVEFPGPMHEENKIRAERRIDEQLAAPVSLGVLQTKQILLSTLNGGG